MGIPRFLDAEGAASLLSAIPFDEGVDVDVLTIVHIHKYLVHFPDYDLIVSVCDSCLDKLEHEYKDMPTTYGGINKLWACCNFCRTADPGSGEEAEVVENQGPVQLEYI